METPLFYQVHPLVATIILVWPITNHKEVVTFRWNLLQKIPQGEIMLTLFEASSQRLRCFHGLKMLYKSCSISQHVLLP